MTLHAGRRRPHGAIPLTAPFNIPTPVTMPTYDGSGQATHPDVVDFGPDGWHGWRYWMANTPYPNGNDIYENPSIVVSQDGFMWETPAGLTNPVEPRPATGYNSDFDICYDPDADRLVGIWRYVGDTEQTFFGVESFDGVTWSAPVALFTNVSPLTAWLSPSLVRVGAGDWRCYGFRYDSTHGAYRVCSGDPMNPANWGASSAFTIIGVLTGVSWHGDVIRDGAVFRMLLMTINPHGFYALSSTDGITWVRSQTPVMLNGPVGAWDETLYRPTLTPHENGLDFRVWHGGFDAASSTGGGGAEWRIGHTYLPRSLWPTP